MVFVKVSEVVLSKKGTEGMDCLFNTPPWAWLRESVNWGWV